MIEQDGGALLAVIQRFVVITAVEVCISPYEILCSYFLLLPLREEAGITLGTAILPRLFGGSLILTLIVSPLTALFLSRPGAPREQSIKQLYTFLGVSLLGFYALYLAADCYVPAALRKDSADHDVAGDIRLGDTRLTRPQRGVRAAFYLWANVQNLIAVSSLWARCADTFTSDAGARLFGFISAGATLGQLAGSVAAMAVTSSAARNLPATGPLYSLLLVSSGLLILAAQQAAQLSPPAKADAAIPFRRRSSPRTSGDGSAPKAALRTPTSAEKMTELIQAVVLIWRSSYLQLLCTFLLMHYTINSLMYFARALVVASSVTGTNARAAFFATVNSYSAVIISGLQLTATGRILQRLGLPVVMCLGPLLALLALLLISLRPTTSTVAGMEVARKVVQYALTRPAREVLFTVVTREEKYKAKLCIDTVVQRLGDALAAAAFDLLDVRYDLGIRGLVLVATPLCTIWLLLSWYLGRQQQRLAHLQSSVAQELHHTA